MYHFNASDLKKRRAPTREDTKIPGDEGELFACNICLEMAERPVVTPCGHLYCWPCIHRWLTSRNPNANACPMCKAAISQETVIPIYVRGRESHDPRQDIPERPIPPRTEAQSNHSFFSNFDFHINLFPFLFPGIQFTFQQRNNAREQQAFQQFTAILGLLILFIVLFF